MNEYILVKDTILGKRGTKDLKMKLKDIVIDKLSYKGSNLIVSMDEYSD